MSKLLVFVALIAAAVAVPPVGHPGVLPGHLDYNPHPQYSYEYKVEDPLTGDFKSQSESRDGDSVTGRYSLLESDGSQRVVEYFADPIHGFNAVVSNSAKGTTAHGIASGAVAPGAVNEKIVAPVHARAGHVASPYAYGHHGYPYAGYGYNPYAGYGYNPYGHHYPYAGHYPRFF